MALLAIIDVDDVATEKIKRTKNALEDLVQAAQKSAQAVARSNAAISQSQGALGGGGGRSGGDPLGSLRQQLAGAHQALDSLAEATERVKRKQAEAAQESGGFGEALDKMKVQAGLVGAALAYLGANMKGVLEAAANLAARVEMLGVVTQITARNAGYTTAQLQAQAEGIKKLGITTQEANDAVLQFVRSNLNLADASKLARVAQNLAVVAGENSSQTFERLTRAIQMQETMLLRQVGIVTTNEQLWREYAQSIGKTVSQLSQAEKQQAFVNKILNEGAKVAGAYEASMDTAGKQLTSMARLTEELSLKIGQALLPAFSLIVKSVFSLLDWLNKLDPMWIKIGASLMAGVTAMTLATGAITSMAVAWKSLATVLAALEISLGPVGWIALGIGVVTAAIVGWSSAAKATTTDLAAQAAVVNEQNKTIADATARYIDLKAAGIELGKTTEQETEKQKQLRTATDELAKAVPTARMEFDKLTNSYVLNRDEIYRVLAANTELRKTLVAGARLQVAALREEKVAAERERETSLKEGNDARARVERLKKELADLEARPKGSVDRAIILRRQELERASTALQNYGAANTDAAKKVETLDIKIKNANELIAEAEMLVPERQKKILEGVTKGWDAFQERAKKVGVSLREALKFTDTTDEGKYRQVIAGLMAEVEKAEKLAADRKAKYTQQFKAALEAIEGTGTATKAQLDAVNLGLSRAQEGTDEYRLRVLRAASAIAAFDKASASSKVGLDALAKASAYLKQIQLDEWAKGVTDSFEKMGTAGAEAMNKVSQGFSGDVTQIFRERRDQEIDLRREAAEKIADIDQEIADKRAEAALEGTDLAIYQENRRVAEIEKALNREIEARDRTDAKAEEAFEERVRQAQAEVREVTRSIQLQMDLRADQVAQEIEFQVLEKKMTEGEAVLRLGRLGEITRQYKAELEERKRMRLDEIEEEAEAGRRRQAQSRTLYDALAKDQRSALDRQKQASAEVVQQMRRDNDAIFQLSRGLAMTLAESVSKGFLDILTQARSTKDAFIGIVRSMADTVLNIISDMVSQWIKRAALMATANGGFNWGTFARSLMSGAGGGGMSVAGLAGSYSQLGMQGGQLVMTGGGAGASAGTSSAGAALMGGTLAAGGGYAVGSLMASKFGRDSYFHSGGIGAASGAATGAAIGSVVPGIGTGVGAGVGAIAGAIGGWLQERKRRKELMKERDQIIEDMGGLDEFKRKAEEAGVALDKFLDTKKSKVYAAELDKIQKAFVALDIKKFIEAQGGMDAIIEKAKTAGIELSDAFKNGTGEAADMNRELEKVAKALQLQEAKEGLARTVTQMDDLRKRAVLVGYDLKKLYDTKTIEEFNNEQAKLNKLLEQQQLRFNGAMTAAKGFEDRVKGFDASLIKSMQDLYSQMSEKAREQFNNDYRKAQEQGSHDSQLEFLKKNADQYDVDLDKLNKTLAQTQDEFNRLGQYAMATFASILRETGDVWQAMEAIIEPLDRLAEASETVGVKAEGAFQHLMEFRNTIRNNEDVAKSLSGINQILRGLSDAGQLTVEMFNTLGTDAAAQWQKLADRGVAADQALLLMQPTLQALYEAQKNFGFVTDEATQALIDMGIANGVVGDQFQSVNQKMLDILVIIAQVLGADIPEAYRKQQAAAEAAAGAGTATAEEQAAAAQDAARQQEEAAKAAEQAKDKTSDLDEKTRAYGDYVDNADWRKHYDHARDGIEDMGRQFETATDQVVDFANRAVEELERVTEAASAISLGHSPGGLKEIRLKTRDALDAFASMRRGAIRDLGVVERSVNAVNGALNAASAEGRGRWRDRADAERPTDSTTIQITMPEMKVDISALNAEGVEKVYAEKIHPRIVHALETNTHQFATRVAKASRRY